MYALQVYWSRFDGWVWIVRFMGYIVDSGPAFDREEAYRQGNYFLAQLERQENQS